MLPILRTQLAAAAIVLACSAITLTAQKPIPEQLSAKCLQGDVKSCRELAKIAKSDKDIARRLAAIQAISDVDVLRQLASDTKQDRSVAESANVRAAELQTDRARRVTVSEFMTLCRYGDLAQVKAVIRIHPEFLQAQNPGDPDGEAAFPLWSAIPNGWYPFRPAHYVETVAFLLESGADPNQKREDGKTALHYASAGAGWVIRPGLNIRINGQTPPDPAPMMNRIRQLLLDKGAAIDACDSEGKTALYYATDYKNGVARDFLTAKGASLVCDTTPRPAAPPPPLRPPEPQGSSASTAPELSVTEIALSSNGDSARKALDRPGTVEMPRLSPRQSVAGAVYISHAALSLSKTPDVLVEWKFYRQGDVADLLQPHIPPSVQRADAPERIRYHHTPAGCGPRGAAGELSTG